MAEQKRSRQFYIFSLIVVSVIWGTGFVATRYALDAGYTEIFILLLRFGLASGLLLAIFRRQILPISKYEWLAGLVCGATLFLGFYLQTIGLSSTTPSINAFFTSCSIIMVPIFIWPIFQQRPRRIVWLGSLICFLGVVVLSVDGQDGLRISLGKGEILTLFCAVSFALHTVLIGYFAVRIPTVRLAFLQLFFAAVLSLLLFVLTGRSWQEFVPRPELGWVLYLTVFTTLICFALQTNAQRYIPPEQSSLIVASESLFASFFSVLLGVEIFRWQLPAGGILIFLAIFLVTTAKPLQLGSGQ